ncbi:MAG: Xaa-Pro peptidase family protein [Acidobacteria bacterium]|nr:Xaa-Pro peptidase family protein [Acidobacteriota bacterium]
MLSIDGCRARQKRLLEVMAAEGTDLFVTSNYRTVYYLTGVLTDADGPTIFGLHGDGRSLLISPGEPESHAADRAVKVETYSIQRTITQPMQDAVRLLHDPLAAQAGSIRSCAIQRAGSSAVLEAELRETLTAASLSDATDTILRLRKKKEEDEIGEIREALSLSAVAYQAAKDTIQPGLTEVDVYSAMDTALTRAAGTTVRFPGDFACGERCIAGGGAPTARVLQAGDLYIFDIFPAPNLYFSDTCRTFAVTEPNDAQLKAWESVMAAVKLGEEIVKPGVKARDAYQQVKDFLDSRDEGKSFWHHLGHGIGHHGHEAPRIIPGTEDVFEVGDVITLEPGWYGVAVQGGIRLEDNYVVREDGLENLFDFPMGLR